MWQKIWIWNFSLNLSICFVRSCLLFVNVNFDPVLVSDPVCEQQTNHSCTPIMACDWLVIGWIQVVDFKLLISRLDFHQDGGMTVVKRTHDWRQRDSSDWLQRETNDWRQRDLSDWLQRYLSDWLQRDSSDWLQRDSSDWRQRDHCDWPTTSQSRANTLASCNRHRADQSLQPHAPSERFVSFATIITLECR